MGLTRRAIVTATKSILLSFTIFGMVFPMSFYVQGAELIDACQINNVFCSNGGRSKLGETGPIRRGVATYSFTASSATLYVRISQSLRGLDHTVFLCPGTISNTGGFTGCNQVGTFRTDNQGGGTFRKDFRERIPMGQVVAINAGVSGTVLANCPNEPNAGCSASLLYSPD